MRVRSKGLLLMSLPLFLMTAFFGNSAETKSSSGGLQAVPVDPSAAPNVVETKILYPKAQELKTSTPIRGQIQLEGIALGVDTEMPRRKEIWNDPEGQSLHIFIDNQHLVVGGHFNASLCLK